MIHTDGKRTIANAGPVPVKRKTASQRIREARELREAALDREANATVNGKPFFSDTVAAERERLDERLSFVFHGPNRGPQDNGQQWNDGYCNCGVAICDSPAGDKCWDCFNHEPGE